VAPKSAKSPPARTSLKDLAATARATEFDLPRIDEEKVAAAGIRRLAGKHLTLYTDLPAAKDVDELPQVFDAAVPLWCEYFSLEPAKLTDWKVIASLMKDKERFVRAGLYAESLPDFSPRGFNVGSQIWVYEQDSAYYRRHLLLHEGTHAVMLRWLGGAGPPWYMEGMAEMLGTHRWQDGKLTLGIMPVKKEDVPYWGRIKIIKDETAAGPGMTLAAITRYDAQAHLQVEPYAWCWAAATFFDQHPLTQAAFRELKNNATDRSIDFTQHFSERLKDQWPVIVEDWQIFVFECDYGYDIARAAVQRKPAADLPPECVTIKLATDRGWQSTGFRLQAGKKYSIKASGRYLLGKEPKPWPCEAAGVTIHYCRGNPLGMLMAGVSDVEGDDTVISPLVTPHAIGSEAELQPEATGTLFLKINEAAGALADNSGALEVTIRAK